MASNITTEDRALVDAIIKCLQFCVIENRRVVLALAAEYEPQSKLEEYLISKLRAFDADEKLRWEKHWQKIKENPEQRLETEEYKSFSP